MTGCRREPRTNAVKSLQRFLLCSAAFLGVWLALAALSLGQTPQPSDLAVAPKAGSISGTVVDKDGALVVKAKVSLRQEGAASVRETLTDELGHFFFANVSPGPFHITFTSAAAGFAPQESSGVLNAGEDYLIPQTTLRVSSTTVDVEVTLKPEDVAEEQIKVEEKQRIFGAIPNYYVSYVPNAVPLTRKQKFELAWKTAVDPVSFGITGIIAGFEQATNTYGGYGQGAQGYGKRYGAAYGDFLSGVFIGGAILPSLLKQDPRYFWKGTGSTKSRTLYAIANAVIAKGDNGHWQPAYSNILGSLASAGISNAYYPPEDRNGARLTFQNTLIGIGGSAFANIVQEFLLRKITPHAQDQAPPRD